MKPIRTTDLLTPETKAVIDHWVKKYPVKQKRSAVLAALTATQKQNEGWLSPELMDAVAHYLELPKIWVYEVATFYDMYDLKPAGKHKIRVCTNVSCMLRGCDKIVDHLKKKLDVDFGETTADGLFVLKEAECLAACCSAPMMMVDLDYHVDLTPEKVDAVLEKIKGESA
jgi:NADH-quinone oxidoreductase subunit E